MHAIETYRDLIKDIEIIKNRIEGLENEYEELKLFMFKSSCPKGIGTIDFSGMPKGSRNDITLDVIVERLNRIDNMLYIERISLKNLEKTREEIEGKVNKWEGINHKIAYKKLIENKSYREIADEVNLSYDRIKHIAKDI